MKKYIRNLNMSLLIAAIVLSAPLVHAEGYLNEVNQELEAIKNYIDNHNPNPQVLEPVVSNQKDVKTF